MAFDLNELNNLDPKNIGNWPLPAKAMVVVVLCLAALALGYFLHISGLRDQLAQAESKEQILKKDFADKYSKAGSLDAYKQQMKDMEDSFGTMLRQLPSKTEVAELLVDITQTGLAAGLTFDLFKPQKEVPLEFYAELPFTLKVSGSYHDFGNFVSGVAALPRIVTLHNIEITKNTDKDKGKELVLTATAKTYRYLDEEEIAAARAEAKKKKKGK